MNYKVVNKALPFLVSAVSAFAASGTMLGSGTVEDPWQIADYKDLKAIGTGTYLYSSHYILTADIDASASLRERSDGHVFQGFTPIGDECDPEYNTAFTGSIDGRNHSIKDLRIIYQGSRPAAFVQTLNGKIVNLTFENLTVDNRRGANTTGGIAAYTTGVIRNVHVKEGDIQGNERVGGIAGKYTQENSYRQYDVDSVSFQGFVSGSNLVGGIVGYSQGKISNAVADVKILADGNMTGGIVGFLETDGIVNCHSTGEIRPTNSKVDEVGGLVGTNHGDIEWSHSSMNLLPDSSGTDAISFRYEVGGLVGKNRSLIKYSYATGIVYGTEYVGGLVGENSRASIRYSYATGTVHGSSYVGGLVGLLNYDAYTYGYGNELWQDYAASQVRGDDHVGGFVGGLAVDVSYSVEDSYWDVDVSGISENVVEGSSGLTTAEMMQSASFKNWGFGETYGTPWFIEEGKSYPQLVEYSSVEDEQITRLPAVAKARNVSDKFMVQSNGSLTEFRFNLARESSVTLNLMDLQGRVVYQQKLGKRGAGSYVEQLDLSRLGQKKFVGVLLMND